MRGAGFQKNGLQLRQGKWRFLNPDLALLQTNSDSCNPTAIGGKVTSDS